MMIRDRSASAAPTRRFRPGPAPTRPYQSLQPRTYTGSGARVRVGDEAQVILERAGRPARRIGGVERADLSWAIRELAPSPGASLPKPPQTRFRPGRRTAAEENAMIDQALKEDEWGRHTRTAAVALARRNYKDFYRALNRRA